MASQPLDITKCLEAGQVCACGNLRKAARAVTQLYDDVLRSAGLRATQLALLVAIKVQGPVTVKDLAETTVTDRTTLTRNLRPLEKQGLIRIEAGEDRRERIVTLTNRGHKALTSALPLWEKAQARIAKGLGQGRLRRLLSDLSVMVEIAQPS